MEKKVKVSNKGLAAVIIILGTAIALIALARTVVGTVDSHEYKIRQAVGSGKLSAIMTPGWYLRNFATIYTFPKTDTVYFSRPDKHGRLADGGKDDWSIDVIFSDNSKCSVSGSTRITMPVEPEKAIDIVAKYSNRNFDDFEIKNVIPLIRRSLITTASTMTAPEGKKQMGEIATLVQDQINSGIYELLSESVKERDSISGEMVTKLVRKIKTDKDGNIIRYADDRPLKDFGVDAKNTVISEIECAPHIEAQIAEQQKSQMEITTSKSLAAKAEQDRITAEKEGDAKIMRIQKEEAAKSQQLIVQAERDKAIRLINADQQVAEAEKKVAEETLLLQSAELEAKRVLIEADARAKAAKMALASDNLLPQRLAILEKISLANAQAVSNLELPKVLIINSGDKNSSSGIETSIQMLSAIKLLSEENAKSLGIDLKNINK